MLAKRKIVIVGSGTAAMSALKQLRRAGCDDEVSVLTMEKHDPYSPMSLPYVVLGRVTSADIRMVPEAFFNEMNAVFMKDKLVTAIAPQIGSISFADGSTQQYHRLLIATGSDPIVPPVLRQAGAMGFHVMDDCTALMERLDQKKRVAIVGAGLVAMEVAAALAAKGHEVTVVAPRERVLRSYFDAEMSTRIIDLFVSSGVAVKLRWGEAVAAEHHGGTATARFAQGNEIEADIFLACIGVRPRMAFLQGSGIEVSQGVVVGPGMRTTIPDVFAAGDCAEAFDPFSGRMRVNPILPNAVVQGRVAGASMAGKEREYEATLPMNAFNFFDHLAFSIGKVEAHQGDEVVTSNRNGSSSRLILTDDCLTGASFIDAEVDAGVIHHLIRKKVRVGKHRDALLRAPREAGYWLMNEAEKEQTVSKEE